MSLTGSIIRQIGEPGYAVETASADGAIVMTATKGKQKYVVYADDDAPETVYVAACALAEMVGVELEDG